MAKSIRRAPSTAKRWEAFGEIKTVAEWANDPRCIHQDAVFLHNRLRQGMTTEKAITEPRNLWGGPRGKSRKPVDAPKKKYTWVKTAGLSVQMVTAFGQTKSVRDWLADPKCEIETCATLIRRLQHGLSPEQALKKLPRLSNARLFEAFGERKSLDDWALDSRCATSRGSLFERVERGVEFELALTSPPSPGNQGVRRKFEAFGEHKSLPEWAADPRCEVSASTLEYKVRLGVRLEAAMLKGRRPRKQGRLLGAFGERKDFSSWLRDPRCVVSEPVLRARLKACQPLEQALTTPATGNVRLVTAFGETKTIREWAQDSRAAGPEVLIRNRLISGWNPETAISQAKPVRLFTAWGESKTLTDWIMDARRRVAIGVDGLRARLSRGMTVEEALTVRTVYDAQQEADKKVYFAFGVRKSFAAWLSDPRCKVPRHRVLGRLKLGMPFQKAISDKSYAPSRRPPVAAFGESKTIQEWALDSRCEITSDMLRQRLKDGFPAEMAMQRDARRQQIQTWEGFGERKSVAEWLSDPRCKVGDAELRRRLTRGLTIEESLCRQRHPTLITAFGESKSALAWARDPRCAVGKETIRKRIQAGIPHERAITDLPGSRPLERWQRLSHRGGFRIVVSAFGEEKTVSEWARDDRAAVGEEAIRQRLIRGFPPELAICEPPANRKIKAFWDLQRRGIELPEVHSEPDDRAILERAFVRTLGPQSKESAPVVKLSGATFMHGFGQFKCLFDWSKDERCVHGSLAILIRSIKQGVSLEEAMSIGRVSDRPRQPTFGRRKK